jgi:RNA-splicing ligase RtcB
VGFVGVQPLQHPGRLLPSRAGLRLSRGSSARAYQEGAEQSQARLREQGIVLVGGGADEAPEVYKRLPDVLAAHAGSVRVKHRLRPLGVAIAGRDIYDPYKD